MTAPEHRLSVRYTPEVVRAATRRFWRRKFGRGVVVAGGIAVAAAVAWFALGLREWYVVAPGAPAVLFAQLGLAVYFTLRSRALASLARLDPPVATWRLTEEGLETESGRGRVRLPWSAVGRVWRFPEVWLVFVGKSRYSTLPTEALAGGAGGFLVERVRDAGGEVV